MATRRLYLRRALGEHRSTQRKVPCGLPDEERLTEDIIDLTREFGRQTYQIMSFQPDAMSLTRKLSSGSTKTSCIG